MLTDDEINIGCGRAGKWLVAFCCAHIFIGFYRKTHAGQEHFKQAVHKAISGSAFGLHLKLALGWSLTWRWPSRKLRAGAECSTSQMPSQWPPYAIWDTAKCKIANCVSEFKPLAWSAACFSILLTVPTAGYHNTYIVCDGAFWDCHKMLFGQVKDTGVVGRPGKVWNDVLLSDTRESKH